MREMSDAGFATERLARSALGPYQQYCVGFVNQGSTDTYVVGLVMEIGMACKRFRHVGSTTLDAIMAYDQAETSAAYLGQVNMIAVSSFCGPQGLIWGHDMAAAEQSAELDLCVDMDGIRIRDGRHLRQATSCLFGSSTERHFPLFPGSFVPSAGRSLFVDGPCHLYAAVGIGIPEKRGTDACLFMEDAGVMADDSIELRSRIVSDCIGSVVEVGRRHRIDYGEIYVDFVDKRVPSDHIGCAFISMPYFSLARRAFNKDITTQSLDDWVEMTRRYFLEDDRNDDRTTDCQA